MDTTHTLPRKGTRVRTIAVIDRYPLFYYDLVGATGVVTQSGEEEIRVKMDPPVLRLEAEWDNQLLIVPEALSGEGNDGIEVVSMADLFALYFESVAEEVGA